MHSPRSRCLRFARLVAQLALSGGCGVFGGQGGDDGGGECPFERTALADDEVAPRAGFAADDLLVWALGERAAIARWRPSPSGIETNAQAGETELVVRIARGEGSAEETICHEAQVEVPVRVRASTGDGLLAFDRPGTLSSTRADFAHLDVVLEFGQLGGTFAWESVERGVELVQPRLHGALTSDAMSGAFDSILQIRTRGAVSNPGGGQGLLLAWPAGSMCTAQEVMIPLGEADPLWSAAVAASNESDWEEIAGASLGMDIFVELSAASALCEDMAGPAVLPVELALRSGDGTVDIELPGRLHLEEDELAVELAYAGGHPDSFADRFGDFGVDLSPYENARIEVDLVLTRSQGEGRFALIGSTDPCVDRPPSEGCGPLEDHILLERSFQTRR